MHILLDRPSATRFMIFWDANYFDELDRHSADGASSSNVMSFAV